MSKRDRRKDKHGNFSESSKSNYNEGTAARTRSFSVEEIMLRRKHKKSVEEVKVLFGEASESSKIKDAEREAAHSKPDGRYAEKKDNHLCMDKQVSEDTSKEIISKKEENKSIRVDHSKVKEKGDNDSEANLRIKSSKDEGIRYKDSKSGKQIRPRKKADDHVRVEMEGEAELKHTKGSITIKERHVEREKKSHREGKRKHIEEADHQHRSEMDGAITKKHDSGRRRDSETLERKNRKKESSHYEESRSRRRRSRSGYHDQDRDRSTSLSPRAYKQMSFRGRDYGDSSFHSTRDRSGRQYFNGDQHRISDNKKYASGGYRRYGGSGLGGYSPRKRRSEAAIKTPSPTVRSPEKKSGAWDLPPAEKDQTSFQSFQEAILESVNQVPTAFPAVSIPLKSQAVDSPTTLSVTKSESIDSIQLTQGTRPMRRLYVENIPASASDKAVLECFNEFFMSSGANHIQGANPCIRCIVNKEKNQALVEFLTPEDATTALSFSGRSLSGSTIKIRRPKDIIDATTGVLEKPISMPVVDAISSVVKDSPNKIFVGGISKTLSSEMLVEICSAFGLLKAYHFEDNEALNQSCAFLEYADHSITHKACAGLNGMKLGGNILTVVQATPDSYAEEIDESPPFYGIPEHAKPLLENPTRVLKFQNLFNQEDLSLMSEPELEEALEDIRLECARFGTVKSFNFISYGSSCAAASEEAKLERDNHMLPDLQDPEVKVEKMESVENQNCSTTDNGKAMPPSDHLKTHIMDEVSDNEIFGNDAQPGPSTERKDSGQSQDAETAKIEKYEVLEMVGESPVRDLNHELDNSFSVTKEQKQASDEQEKPVTTSEVERPSVTNNKNEKLACFTGVFEQGCVFVEFLRSEAACTAAHCLHGRSFGDKIVGVQYIDHGLYLARFTK